MSANINVTITGDQQLLTYLRSVTPRIQEFLDVEIDSIAQELRNEMMMRMHRRSGDMANSTRVEPVANGKAVTVNVSYADEENRRPGVKRKSSQGTGQGTRHQYLEPSVDIVVKRRIPQLITRLHTILNG